MKKMLLLIFGLAVVFSLVGCSSLDKKVDEDSLQNQIILNIQKHDGKQINFEEAISGFEWDKVYIFTPYTTVKSINKAVGYQWLTHDQGIQYRDDINLVAFTKGDKVVQSVEVPRQYGDFQIKDPNGIDKENSVVDIAPASKSGNE